MQENKIRRIVSESVRKVLREWGNEGYDEQWEEEIEMFLDGLKNGSAICDENAVYVNYEGDEDRYIYLKRGERRLSDDSYYIQHSRTLDNDEMKIILNALSRYYGEDWSDEYYDIYDDEYYKEGRKIARKPLSEAYGYPEGIDGLILCSENDRECYDIYYGIIKMLKKHFQRGEELTVDRLANSSIMKKYQQFVFRKFRGEQEGMNRATPYQFRQYIADRMISQVTNGEY